MRICVDASRLSLAQGEVAVLHDAAGARIESLSGLLWITQDQEVRDVMLRPGEVFTLERNGKTVIQALRTSQAWLAETVPIPVGAPWWKRAGYAVIGYLTELGMRRSAWRRAYRI